MKKILKVVCCLIFLISGSLIVFACKNDAILLQKPITLSFVNAGDRDETTGETINNKFLLVTDKNRYASGYKFFLTDNQDYENRENYIALKVVQENFVNVTNLIDRQKQYHFFVQYIGSKRYKDSEFSDIKTIEPEKTQVSTPTLQMIDTKLFWFRIQNATGYEIYETKLDKNDNILSKTKIADVGENVFEFDFSSRLENKNAPYYKFSYQIKAKASGNYLTSSLSEIKDNLTYIKKVNLETPKNLIFNFETKTLTFDAVDYVTKYSIKVNKTGYEKIIKASNNSIDLEASGVDFSDHTTYSFSVTSVDSDVVEFISSKESDTLKKDYTTNFSKPENIQVSHDVNGLIISFDKSEVVDAGSYVEAQSYCLIIGYDSVQEEFVIPRSKIDGTTKLTLSVKFKLDIFKNLTDEEINNKEITIKIKAQNLNQYILESEFSGYVNSDNQSDKYVINL